MISPALNEKFCREYMAFFEQAERTRRWNPFTAVDWDALKDAPQDDALALCAETFCGVEMYLPDYLDGHLDLFRDNWARAWFAATWGYEESKHALTLWRYLVKGGYRTDAQMRELAGRLLAQKWRPPFTTGRAMTVYGVVQEMSRDDRYTDLLQKLAEYHRWGVPHIWVADPWLERLSVYDGNDLRQTAALGLPGVERRITIGELIRGLKDGITT